VDVRVFFLDRENILIERRYIGAVWIDAPARPTKSLFVDH
jgi:hypothetical protein